MSGFTPGLNWQWFGIPAVDVPAPTPASVQRLIGLHDVLVLQHWPTLEMAQWLKTKTRKLILWTDFESIPATTYYSSIQTGIWDALFAHRLLVATPNRFGRYEVDQYEGSAGGPFTKPHVFTTDMGSAGLVDDFLTALEDAAAMYGDLISGFLFDQCLKTPYFGTASNPPMITDEYTTTYRAAWNAVHVGASGEVWGNSGLAVLPGDAVYRNIHVRWDELFFTASSDQRFDDKLRNPPSQVVLNVEQTYAWATAHEADWPRLLAYPNVRGLVTCRGSKYLFYPPGLRSR